MSKPDETFIVRVREREGDAVVEQPRLSRRRRIRDVADVGALIARWLGPRPEGGHLMSRTDGRLQDEED